MGWYEWCSKKIHISHSLYKTGYEALEWLESQSQFTYHIVYIKLAKKFFKNNVWQ